MYTTGGTVIVIDKLLEAIGFRSALNATVQACHLILKRPPIPRRPVAPLVGLENGQRFHRVFCSYFFFTASASTALHELVYWGFARPKQG